MGAVRAARRTSSAIGLALALVLTASATPADARGNDNGRGASRRVPITQIPRRVIDPLVRDAVRGVQRTLESVPRVTTTLRRAAQPEPEPKAPAPDPTPPAVVETVEEVVEEEVVAAPEPTLVAPVPPVVAPAIAAVDETAPPPEDSSAPTAAFAALAFAVAIALGAWIRRRRRPHEVAVAPALVDASPRATLPRMPAAIEAATAPRALAADGADELALARLDEALAGDALAQAAPDALDQYALLLAEAGRHADALRVLEALRLRDPARSLATRIEQVRKRADALTVPRAAAASPFPAAGRYEILGEIGRGGMGVVYRARDTRLDRVVALKRLSQHLRDHPRAVALLLQEARSAARLNHPNIVTVYDVDHEDGAYFITMELMEGQALDAVVQRRGKLTPKAAAWVGQHAAAGLAYAHERRIVHRDVKTANLFITRERSLKIMDFGLAKIVEEVRRRASLIAGTPSYMAPEQAQGIEVDGRADLYALGVTLFELLTGSLPFEHGDPAYHHLNTPVPDPRERAQDVPDAFAELVMRLMAKQPAERPAATGEVVARLAALNGS